MYSHGCFTLVSSYSTTNVFNVIVWLALGEKSLCWNMGWKVLHIWYWIMLVKIPVESAWKQYSRFYRWKFLYAGDYLSIFGQVFYWYSRWWIFCCDDLSCHIYYYVMMDTYIMFKILYCNGWNSYVKTGEVIMYAGIWLHYSSYYYCLFHSTFWNIFICLLCWKFHFYYGLVNIGFNFNCISVDLALLSNLS